MTHRLGGLSGVCRRRGPDEFLMIATRGQSTYRLVGLLGEGGRMWSRTACGGCRQRAVEIPACRSVLGHSSLCVCFGVWDRLISLIFVVCSRGEG